MKLRSLQQDFLDAVGSSFPSELDLNVSEVVLKEPAVNQKRLKIYFRNALMARIKALKHTFPVVVQLLGEECFQALAKCYIDETPSQSVTLNQEGKGFLEFVTSGWDKFPSLHSLVYLRDTLHWEWCLHQSLVGPQNSIFNFQAFADLSESDYPNLRFTLAENGYLFSSKFPVDTLWEAHQPETQHKTEEISLQEQDNETDESQKIRLFAWRPQWDIHILRLTETEWQWLNWIKKGYSLREINKIGQEKESGKENDKEFGKEGILPKLIQLGCVVDFN